jgi:predicted nucleic acid-binding protein
VIVVDTSVWIDSHRRPAGAIAGTLKDLLDADEVALALPVRLELAAGVSRRDRPALLRALSGLPLVRPSDETWRLIERWGPAAADKRQQFRLRYWLIAALTRWACLVTRRGFRDAGATEIRAEIHRVSLEACRPGLQPRHARRP